MMWWIRGWVQLDQGYDELENNKQAPWVPFAVYCLNDTINDISACSKQIAAILLQRRNLLTLSWGRKCVMGLL